ncbi:MAG: hypothetical protein JWM53_715 [bacterium]|nr:hypothetical protein [bacterium]
MGGSSTSRSVPQRADGGALAVRCSTQLFSALADNLDMKITNLVLIATALSASACTLQVQKSDPKPNVVFAKPTEQRLGLRLASAIANDANLPEKNGIGAVELHGWRDTLGSGFQNAYRSYFKVSADGQPAERVIEIARADLEFAPTAVTARSGVAAVEAHITYQARLLDAAGAPLKVVAHTATSKSSVTERTQMSDCAASAVETMYEELSKELF